MISAMPRVAIAGHDFEALVALFRDKFGLPVVDLSPGSVETLGARLAMCVPEGGSNIELMSPADPDAPLSLSLNRFLERRGAGLFALMLEAEDPDVEAEELLGRGLNVLPLMHGAGGRDVHPGSTHGVLIRIYPTDSFVAPAEINRDTSATTGLSGIARVMIAVVDLDDAITTYRDQLGLTVAPAATDRERGVRYAICSPPRGGQIELLSVHDADRPFAAALAGFIAGKKEGLYALVLETRDLAATAKALDRSGIEFLPCTGSRQAIECAGEQAGGALLRIEQRNP